MRIDSPAQFVADFLKGGLWHTTSTDRFKLIQRDGAIRVNPPVQDSQRHKTANGPENYPFVRSLGGVSLFGFSEFEQVEYQARYPVSNWHAFVPVWQAWSSAIWIEIDRDITGSAIIEPQALLDNWKKTLPMAIHLCR